MRSLPEWLLVCYVRPIARGFGWWWFSLQNENGPLLVAHDYEQLRSLELHQLCLVRGLEAIEGPAHVHLALGRSSAPPCWREQRTDASQESIELWETSSSGQTAWQQRLRRCWTIHQVELLPRLPWDLGALLEGGSRNVHLVLPLAWRWFRRVRRRRSHLPEIVSPARRWLRSA